MHMLGTNGRPSVQPKLPAPHEISTGMLCMPVSEAAHRGWWQGAAAQGAIPRLLPQDGAQHTGGCARLDALQQQTHRGRRP
jgi:hypothetical protein